MMLSWQLPNNNINWTVPAPWTVNSDAVNVGYLYTPSTKQPTTPAEADKAMISTDIMFKRRWGASSTSFEYDP
jgi:hypothetical protein